MGIARRNLWTLLVPATAGFILAGVWALIAPDVFRSEVIVDQATRESATDEFTRRQPAQKSTRELMRQVRERMLRHSSPLPSIIDRITGSIPDIVNDKEKGMTVAVARVPQGHRVRRRTADRAPSR